MQRKLNWRRAMAGAGLPYVLALGQAFGVTGNGAGNRPFAFHEDDVLGTSLDVQVAAGSQQDADKAFGAVKAEVERLRKILSTYDPASAISRVNMSKDAVAVPQELIDVLRLYEQWSVKTGGTYTGGLGEVVKTWKQAEQDGRAPDAAKLAALAVEIKKPLWRIDQAARRVQRLTDETINVDSLGKGLIVTRAALTAKAAAPGIEGVLVNIGGDITVIGSSSGTGNAPWMVPVVDPAHPEENAAPLTALALSSISVATSGSYARGYQIAGKQYSHLLDPRKAAPVDFGQEEKAAAGRVISATAIAADNASANALATSLCLLPAEQGLALTKASGAECLLVMADGSQKRSAGFARYEPAKRGAAAGTAAGAGFASGYKVSIALQLKALKARAYCAVWIEDSRGKYVKTLAIWGNQKKYIKTVTSWWKLAEMNQMLAASATRATRGAGSYPLAWDGTNDAGKAVAAGNYKVIVETSAEHSGHQMGSATIECGNAGSTATIAATPHFDEIKLTYAPAAAKGN